MLAFLLAIVVIGVGIAPAVAEEDEREAVAEFSAIGTEGFVDINTAEIEDPIAFPEPDEVEQPISIEGTIYDDGTWVASKADVSFPDIDEDVDDSIPTDVVIEAGSELSGELDRETGAMTVHGTLHIFIPEADAQIDVTSELTTGQSGEMQGSTADLDTDSGTVTLVDNEFVVPETTGNFAIDGFIGLPSDEPGMNWFDLTLDMEFSDVTDDPVADYGSVSGKVFDDAGEPIQGATVSTADESTTTDSDGAYELTLPADTHEITVDAPGFEALRQTIDVTANATVTVDDITLEAAIAPPAFTTTAIDGTDVEPGETVTIEGTITNTGGPGEQQVSLSIAEEKRTETLSLDANEQATLTLEWETTVDDEGDHEAVLESEDDRISTTILVGEADIDLSDADFVARSTGGYITFGRASYAEIASDFGMDTIETHEDIRQAIDLAHEADNDIYGPDMSLPDKHVDDEPVVLAGTIDEEAGTWELIDGFFPELTDPAFPFNAFIDVPDGIEGTFDYGEPRLSAETTFDVYVDGRDDATFSFDVELHSEGSGEIPTGMGEIDNETDTAYVHLVSNDFVVDDETGDALIDAELSLPSTDPSENYFELGFEIDLDPEGVAFDDEEVDRTEPAFQDDSIFLDAGVGIGATGIVVALAFIGTSLLVRVSGS